MASAGLRDDDGCIHATSRKALKTRRLQKQTSSMHAIPSRRSNGVVLERTTRMEAMSWDAEELRTYVAACDLERSRLWGIGVGSASNAAIIKRAIDLIGSAIGLAVLSPLLLLISLLVRATSPG